MDNFAKEDFMVVPIQDTGVVWGKIPNYDGHGIKWSDQKNWVSWQEREDFYPNCTDWYVIPPLYAKYHKGCMEVGYYVIDVDNHDGDKFEEAEKEIESWGLPKTLVVRTKSGGKHYYFWTFADALPRVRNDRKDGGLPIEIKVHTGWVAPNGRDRIIEEDNPIAPLHVVAGTKFGDFASYKKEYKGRRQRKPVDPNFKLPDIPSYPESMRHDSIIRDVKALQDAGCPPELVEEYVDKVIENSPGSRQIRDREIKDIINWEGATERLQVLVDRNKDDLKELEADLEDPLEGAVELTGLDLLEAQAVFSTEEEKVELRKKYREIRGY